MLKIRNIKLSELDILNDFTINHYRNNHVLNNEKYIKWHFRGPVKNYLPDELTILGLFKNKKLLGILPHVPIYIHNGYGTNKDSNKILSNHIVEFHILKKYQNLGGGFLLLRELMKRYRIGFGFAPQKNAIPLYNSMRMKILRPINRYIGILNKRIMYNLVDSQEKMHLLQINNHNQNDTVYKYELMKELPSNMPINNKNYSVGDYSTPELYVIKDRDYLEWRYENHICFKYEYHCLKRKDKILSAIVLRYDEVDNLGYKIAFISDIIGNRRLAVKKLFPKILIELKNRKVDFLDFFMHDDRMESDLKILGFNSFSNLKSFEDCIFPLYYHPVGYAPCPNTLCYNLDVENYNESNWLITGAFSHLDRPAGIENL